MSEEMKNLNEQPEQAPVEKTAEAPKLPLSKKTIGIICGAVAAVLVLVLVLVVVFVVVLFEVVGVVVIIVGFPKQPTKVRHNKIERIKAIIFIFSFLYNNALP